MKATYNKSEIMKRAWKLFKAQEVRTMEMWSTCLRNSWGIAKGKTVKAIKPISKTFEEIYAENYDSILRHINIRVNDPEVAEELVNDVFMKVHKHMGNYDESRSAIPTWVRNIANNTIIDHFRCNRYANNRTSASDFNNGEGISEFQFTSPEEADTDIENSELGQEIMNSFRSLKPKYRRVAVLYFLNQKQYKEIAEILNIPMGTVFGMISRCRAMLQDSLVTVR